MGHQCEPPFERIIRVVELKLAVAIGKAREDFAEMAVDRLKGLHEGLLPQRGHGFDPEQQLLPLLAEHIQPFTQIAKALFEFLQLLQGEHVHRLQGFHAQLQLLQAFLKTLETILAQLVGDLGQWIRQGGLQLLQAQSAIAKLLLQ